MICTKASMVRPAAALDMSVSLTSASINPALFNLYSKKINGWGKFWHKALFRNSGSSRTFEAAWDQWTKPLYRPIRHRLSGGPGGAPSTARRGRAGSRSSGGQAKRAGVRDGSPQDETPSVARCAARQPGPASPGDVRIFVEPAIRFYSKPQKHETTFTHLRKPTEPYIRKIDFVSMHESGLTYPRQAVHTQARQSAKKATVKKPAAYDGPLTCWGS